MDAPERMTLTYWDRELKLQRISPERTKEFFEAVMGKYYTRPLNLYIGNDGMYYVYFPDLYEHGNKKNNKLLDKTGITKKIILDRETKRYKTLDENALRDVLYNISCIEINPIRNWETKQIELCKKWGPTQRMERKIFIEDYPPREYASPVREDNECFAPFTTYGPRILTTIVSEEETNAILKSLYGRTDDYVFLMFDKVRKEYFIQEEICLKNTKDDMQISCDFDYEYIEQYFHIYEKFDKPNNHDEMLKILDYFEKDRFTTRLKIIKTGLFQNMLILNNNSSSDKYKPVSFDNLQRAYFTIIYNHRETW